MDPELHRWDADVTLRLTMKSAVLYGEPVDDPMFSAHREVTYRVSSTGDNVTMYLSDNPGSVMGCAQQVRIRSCARSAANILVVSILSGNFF